MSRLVLPLLDRRLQATGDVLLRAELRLLLRNGTGLWKDETFLVDSGSEMTTVPAWKAAALGLPIPQRPTRGLQHGPAGVEVRSGLLRLTVVGMDATEYVIPCYGRVW